MPFTKSDQDPDWGVNAKGEFAIRSGSKFKKVATIDEGQQTLTITTSPDGGIDSGGAPLVTMAFPGHKALPPPAAVWEAGPHRQSCLVFGCSISAQAAGFMHATTDTVAVSAKAGAKAITVNNGALFSGTQRVAIMMFNNRVFVTTIDTTLGIVGNVINFIDPLPAYVAAGNIVTICPNETMPNMDQGYGAANAAIALLGGPVEVLPDWGYGGAIVTQMLPFMERELRYYRPRYVITHMYENDLCGAVATGSATLDQMKAWARQQARMCLSYGAVPIICSSMPYYKLTGVGIPASRTADFDGLLDYLCKPVTADGLSQLQVDVPGSYGLDLSTGWLDQDFINDSSFARRPIFAKLVGGALSASEQALSNWTGITSGAFAVALDGTTRQITGLNFSAVTSMADVAARIKTAMGTNGMCTFEGNAFVLRCPASIAYIVAPSSGTDISAKLKLTSATAASISQGWTDGVHPLVNKRFAVGQIAAPALQKILPPAGSLLDYVLTPREMSAMAGTGGTAPTLQAGSVVPKSHQVVAAGAAVVTTSKNADGSLKFRITWPGTASRLNDYVQHKFTWTFPVILAGNAARYRQYCRFRILSMVGVTQIAPDMTITSTVFSDNHTGSTGIGNAESIPADGRIIVLETPVFSLGPSATAIALGLVVRPTDGYVGASIEFDAIEMGILPVMPEAPHSFI